MIVNYTIISNTSSDNRFQDNIEALKGDSFFFFPLLHTSHKAWEVFSSPEMSKALPALSASSTKFLHTGRDSWPNISACHADYLGESLSRYFYRNF
jgi:hypothetical protein